MIASLGWATRQLAEFLAVLAEAPDDLSALDDGLECLAFSFAADACAFLRASSVEASRGWTGGHPGAEVLAAARSEDTGVLVPGAGWCETVAIGVDREAGTTLLIARAGRGFTAEEVGLLRAMARVLGLALRLLGSVAVERQHVEDNQRHLDQNKALLVTVRERQALLERLAQVQHKISSRRSLDEVFDAITAGAAELLGDEMVALRLVDESELGMMVVVSSVHMTPALLAQFARAPVGTGVAGRAIVQDQFCVAEDYQEADGALGAFADNGVHSAMAAPVRVAGRAVGSLAVASRSEGRTYSEAERNIVVGFADHAGLALNDARTVQAMDKALNDAMHQAMHDELTALPNRACFFDRTDQALRQASREGSRTAVLLFDLDRFKEINDTLGHKYGDRVLCEVGPRIRPGLRAADTLARLGGDEFCVLLPDVGCLAAAVEVAERLLGLLEEPFEIDGMTLAVEASCGISIAPDDGDSSDLLLQRADVAMYLAKNSHANLVVYHDDLNFNTPARLSLLGELRMAIPRGQLVLHYQPKAVLSTGEAQGVEALIRWQHPTLGLVPPDQFIPMAEHTGLIKALTSWVLNTALCQLRDWRERNDQHFPHLSMAVNLSTRSLLDDAFPAEVVAALGRWHVPADMLELEITESSIMSDPVKAHRLLSELSAIGVRIAIDDFGTGYSSLAYLKDLPVDQLKIDKSFVLNMQCDPDDAIIVKSVIDLGHNLGLQTVAEGIEDLDTWQQLTNLGCDSAQGYFLAKPLPAADLETWFQQRGTLALEGTGPAKPGAQWSVAVSSGEDERTLPAFVEPLVLWRASLSAVGPDRAVPALAEGLVLPPLVVAVAEASQPVASTN
jgi:diguanylate cyclase (GGDEF)-like protein